MSRNRAISAIVPARNEEATIARAVESLAGQPEIAEIIVINDQSTDRTARILQALAASVPNLRVLETQPLPAGWVGKNYALALGALQAAGDWLLFTDADAVHLPGSAARALADAAAAGAALVSYSPEQEMKTWWERALVPFVYCRLAQRFSFAEVSDSHSPAAAANGQYLLIRRDAYQAIGGHASVRGEVLEDVALAERVKQAGYPISFAPGQGIARVRMYRSFAQMWQGWTKNLYPLAGGSAANVRRELFSVVPWVPVALLLAGPVHRLLPWLGLLLLAGRHAAYAAMLRRNQFPVSCVLYYLPAVLLYSSALLVSAWQYARGAVVWKGRVYPVGTPSR
ncbi:MAG TPA: glycosyltransferase [Candidatus Acidoferrales bacterium]|nr:glycosyltransferase [Candidatus Acidoferrales bacterium]